MDEKTIKALFEMDCVIGLYIANRAATDEIKFDEDGNEIPLGTLYHK